ncbi:ATPase [Leptospira gomenensis]|uniref:ATPase n=1 Tax=Leptospira gomenensis TaxID=2484974 RepID=A0A5F1YEK7_9LEPT|nr:SRPBCC domain-containing protein [Leptospira gomenensis]TGK36072.1 ATPase [Leptospira gomenensis]TGK41818.1 ATPase [Leptospira gomenensis]TGK53325.1 ATPase [Leptospira gomenensis]TGK64931.1 ATPase [Leptospira gomenensis]
MKPTPILKKDLLIRSPLAKVWEGLIDPKIIKLYLYGTDTFTDWKVGSPIVFTGTWEEKEYRDHGTILKFEPEKILQYDYWSGFSGLPDLPENYSLITIELSPEGNSTRLRLTHENLPTQTAYEHSDGGWDHSLQILKEFLEK